MTDITAIHNTAHIAASCLDGKIYVLDLGLMRIGKALSGHHKGVTMLKYCANTGYLVSGGLDHCVNLWNPHVEQKIGSLKGHRHQLIGLEVVPDSPQVISADDSGLIKIWDLRKFAPVRAFKREAYIQNHTLPRTLTRPMQSMCYIPSRKRLAIAHSCIFFVDLDDGDDLSQRNIVREAMQELPHNERSHCGFDREGRSKPLAIVFHGPSDCIVVITPRELQSWVASSGDLIRRENHSIRVYVTCASIVEDQYSCVVGTEDGTVARVMLPRGAVILSKQLHAAEVAAIRWVSGSRQIVSSSFDGIVLICQSANMEVVYALNHSHSIQSVRNKYDRRCDNGTEEADTILPESCNTANKVEDLIRLFNAADYAKTGKITARKAKELLDEAFPIPKGSESSGMAKKTFAGREAITLTAFMKNGHSRLKEIQQASIFTNGYGGPDAVTIDVHGKLQHLVTVSSFDGTFCVWKVKGGAVVATGTTSNHDHDSDCATDFRRDTARLKTPLIGPVVYLDPHPYFVLIEEGHPCQLSIWCSKAIPPVFPYAHQRILCLQYDYDIILQHDAQLTSQQTQRSVHGDALICAVAWTCGETNNALCVGDDQGGCACIT
ncbi:unnamed protein product [Phytophthora fragariaefolia]|uniref:Unnamed protein product n=1 Tax=Phytophthora fragariaefolia TaxID=1490495 RepID=A0A9W7DCW5_9STRA|nr:unnamed protein product [Phytophthora fragariaefolia]